MDWLLLLVGISCLYGCVNRDILTICFAEIFVRLRFQVSTLSVPVLTLVFLVTDPVWEKRRNLLEPMFDQISARLDVVNQHAKKLAGELAPKVQNGFFDPIEILQNTIMGILLSK